MEWWQYGLVVGGILAAVFGGYATAYIRMTTSNQELKRKNHELEKQKRDETIEEWRLIAKTRSDDFTKRTGELELLFAALRRDVIKFERASAECEAREIILSARVKALESGSALADAEMVAPFAVITASMKGEILDAGGATALLFGRRPAQMIGKNVREFIESGLVEKHDVAMASAESRGSIKRGNESVAGRTKNGVSVIIRLVMSDDEDFKQQIVTATVFEFIQPKK